MIAILSTVNDEIRAGSGVIAYAVEQSNRVAPESRSDIHVAEVRFNLDVIGTVPGFNVSRAGNCVGNIEVIYSGTKGESEVIESCVINAPGHVETGQLRI